MSINARMIVLVSNETVILTGAALIREREQGTVEHLLVMPVVPAEIMLSKIVANGFVVLAAAGLPLLLVVQWWLQVPIAGSILLRLLLLCLHRRGAGYSSRYDRIHNGPVRIARQLRCCWS
jgi:ABC-type Na+ efflux pump permease subunit